MTSDVHVRLGLAVKSLHAARARLDQAYSKFQCSLKTWASDKSAENERLHVAAKLAHSEAVEQFQAAKREHASAYAEFAQAPFTRSDGT